MKAYSIIALALAIGTTANAQTYIDALRFNKTQYEGTARSQAMGSAFGALGADLTSQSINPAGIAAYRATEIGIGFGVSGNNTTTNYYGFEREDDKVKGSFNVIGVAFNLGNIMRENATGILNHNLSISYSKTADFNRNALYEDLYGSNSMLDYFCSDACYNDIYTQRLALRTVEDGSTDKPDAAWWLYKEMEDEDGNVHDNVYTSVWDDAWMENGKLTLNLDARVGVDENGNPIGLIDHSQAVNETGKKGETSFSYGMNISNKVYLGAALGIASYHYKEHVYHYEKYYGTPFDNAKDQLEFGTDLNQEDNGVNFKFGAIAVPISQLRIGLAVHSPTFYTIEERYQTWLNDAYDDMRWYSPTDPQEYKYRAPGKFVGSLAGIIGRFGIVSVDYELTNNSKGKFKSMSDKYSYDRDMSTQSVKNNLKTTHTIRVGAEGRIMESMYLRAGYNMQTNPYKNGVLERSYKNDAISGGFGYRTSNFFIDLSYTCQRDKTERWVLPDSDVYCYDELGNHTASAETKSHKATITLGLRF